jgi:hypothetical protein
LNYIYANRVELNNSLLLNGDYPLDDELSYWSSTSMCSLKCWNNASPSDRQSYVLAETPNEDHNIKFRFTTEDFNLGEIELYDLSMNTCAGETMLSQNFSDGLVKSQSRNEKLAALRPVRRIPIVKVTCNNDYSIVNAYSGYNFQECKSCPNGC